MVAAAHLRVDGFFRQAGVERNRETNTKQKITARMQAQKIAPAITRSYALRLALLRSHPGNQYFIARIRIDGLAAGIP